MAQLKMYRFNSDPVEELALPEGYSVSTYKDESDKLAWCECCKNGLVGDDAGVEAFDGSITSREDINLFEDVFFLDYNGEHIATITAYVDSETNIGDVHMVGMKKEYRGQGLAKYLNNIAVKHLAEKDIEFSLLTTDEWRKGAIASYVRAGFKPVEYDTGMEKRWQAIVNEYGFEELDMYYEDGSFFKTLKCEHQNQTVRKEKCTSFINKKIIVAGAGHGGIVAAYYLAQNGYDVTVFEKNSCGSLGHDQYDSVHTDGFEKSGMPIPEEYYTKRTPIAFCVPESDLEPLVQADNNETYNIEIDRKALYEHLITPALAAGVKFVYDCEVYAPVVLGSRVAGIRTSKGTFYADMIIDACGVHSPLRTQLPDYMHIERDAGKYDVLQTYRACFNKVEGEEEPEQKYRVSLIPGEECGLTWMITKADCVDILISSFTQLTDEFIEHHLNAYRTAFPVLGTELVSGGKKADIPVRQPLGVMVADGYAAIGDSAFMTIPIKGSGVGYSMRAGKLLAECILEDKDGLFNREKLWKYQADYYKDMGSSSCLLAIVKDLLPFITLDDMTYAFSEKIVSSEDMEMFGNEAGMMNIITSLRIGALTDKAKKAVGNPNVRKLLLTIVKNVAKYLVVEKYFHEKYDSDSIEKWAEVYENFFEGIKQP